MSLSATHLWAYFGEWSERAIAWELLALAREGVDLRILSFRPARAQAEEDPAIGQRVSDLDPFPRLGGTAGAALGSLASLPAALLRPKDLASGHQLAQKHWASGFGLRFRSAARRAALERRLRAAPPDVLHAQHAHVGWWALPAARSMGVPLVVSVRGIDLILLEKLAEGRWGEFAESPCLLLARSGEMAERLRRGGAPPERVAVHPSGIPVDEIPFRERHPPDSGANPAIVSVGRLVPKKGMEDAIRAFAASAEAARLGAVLRIVGDGPLRGDLEALARRLEVAKRVSFLGRLCHSDAVAEMSRADVFLLASRAAGDGDREGVPNAVKEAAASGLPVVSTTHAGIPEAVRHGETGLLAPEGDADALTRALDEVLARPEQWAEMGRKGRALVEAKYDVRALARKLVERYQSIVV